MFHGGYTPIRRTEITCEMPYGFSIYFHRMALLISITFSNKVNGDPFLFAEVTNAEVSFGKHIPPKPRFMSDPGTIIWLSPIRGSMATNSVSSSNDLLEYNPRS